MKRVKLIAQEDRELGGCGLVIEGMRPDVTVNPAQDGLTLAHDLVEHVNGVWEIGTIDDELEALGAIWFVRGQFNDLRRDNRGSQVSVHQNIAADVVRMFRDFFYGAPVDLVPLKTKAHEEDSEFKTILDYAFDDMPGEIDAEDRGETFAARRARYMAVCLPRLRRGYRKAAAKYKSGIFANKLFWTIAEATESVAKHAQPGEEYTLTYGLTKNGGVYVRLETVYGEEV